MANLIVSEIFGPTIQGEGPSAGRVANFVRLGLCNLDCAWCDTPWTWDWTGKNGPPQDRDALWHMSHGDVFADLQARTPKAWRGLPLTVVTGGEPMLQKKALLPLIQDYLRDVEIETNGTITAPDQLTSDPFVRFNVSPKLPSAHTTRFTAVEAVENYAPVGNAVFKFVACAPADLDEVTGLVTRCGVSRERVWIMPEGRQRDDITGTSAREIAEEAIRRGYNVSSRLHVLLWNDERGR